MDTVDHVLDEGCFSIPESSLVRDIVGSVIGLRVLSMDSSDLNVEFIGNGVELGLVFSKLWKFDMNRSSQSGTEIGWARGDETEMFVVTELCDLLNSCSGSAESIEDVLNFGSFFHGDNSKLIFFVDPDEESLLIIVEDTST